MHLQQLSTSNKGHWLSTLQQKNQCNRHLKYYEDKFFDHMNTVDSQSNIFPLPEEIRKKTVLQVWEILTSVKQLNFTAKANLHSSTGWDGEGSGNVMVSQENSSSLIFQEKGVWKGQQGEPLKFSNSFKWTLDLTRNVISLEHLRRGPNFPVFLLDLKPINANTLVSIDSHACGKDSYFGEIRIDSKGLHFIWKIVGPKKSETLTYHYF